MAASRNHRMRSRRSVIGWSSSRNSDRRQSRPIWSCGNADRAARRTVQRASANGSAMWISIIGSSLGSKYRYHVSNIQYHVCRPPGRSFLLHKVSNRTTNRLTSWRRQNPCELLTDVKAFHSVILTETMLKCFQAAP